MKSYFMIILVNFCLVTDLFASENLDKKQLSDSGLVETLSSENKVNHLWAEKYLNDMTPEQLQIILNVLHLSCIKVVSSESISKLETEEADAELDTELSNSGDRQAPLRKLALFNITSKKLKKTIADDHEIDKQFEVMASYVSNLKPTLKDPIENVLDYLTGKEARSFQEIEKTYDHYQEVYSFMEAREITDPKYYKLIVSADGVIPEEDRKRLLKNRKK